jgi:hypothetical protein
VRKDVRICGYFSKPKQVHEQTRLGNVGVRCRNAVFPNNPTLKTRAEKFAK